MNSPITGNPMTEVTKPTTVTVRGHEITLSGRFWQCPDTNECFSTTEQGDEFFNAVFAELDRLEKAQNPEKAAEKIIDLLNLKLSALDESCDNGTSRRVSTYKDADPQHQLELEAYSGALGDIREFINE